MAYFKMPTGLMAAPSSHAPFGQPQYIGPDIDVNLVDANLGDIKGPSVAVEIEGLEVMLPGTEDDYRYVVYDKEIQFVRKVDSFLTYHKKNPGSLEHMLSNIIWAQFLPELELQNMYNRALSNRAYNRPIYEAHNKLIVPSYFPSRKEVPIKSLLDISQRWMQGLVLETFGAKGFEMIKRAKEKAAEKLTIKKEPEKRTTVRAEVWHAEVSKNQTVFTKEALEDMMEHVLETSLPSFGAPFLMQDGRIINLQKNRGE